VSSPVEIPDSQKTKSLQMLTIFYAEPTGIKRTVITEPLENLSKKRRMARSILSFGGG